MIKNDLSKKFSKGTIVTHWLTAVLILTLFPLGKYMEGIPASEKMQLVKVHALLGIIVFVLTLVRSYLFFNTDRPKDIKTGSKINDRLVVWIHNLFYFLLFAISLSGIATMILGGYGEALKSGNFELIKPHGEIAPLKGHGITAFFMMVLLFLHVVGVVKHYVMTKENTLKRLL